MRNNLCNLRLKIAKVNKINQRQMHKQKDLKLGLESLVEKQDKLFLMILTIGNLQSMKGRMVVKWNWRKSPIFFPGKMNI